MVKEVPIAPHLVEFNNLDLGDLGDLGDLCPKFDIMGAEALNELVPPRKPSNIALAQAE